MVFRSYAQRLLNPFRGVMNIIEYQGAEAVTTDGRHWDIYARDTGLVEDIANGHKVQTSDIRYGSWSLKDGLKRGAIYPCDDFRELEHRGALVYEYLLKHHNDVPFPLKDRIELWLLDEQHLPLGLLDSARYAHSPLVLPGRSSDLQSTRRLLCRAALGHEVEAVVDQVEQAGTVERAADALRQHIELPGGGVALDAPSCQIDPCLTHYPERAGA